MIYIFPSLKNMRLKFIKKKPLMKISHYERFIGKFCENIGKIKNLIMKKKITKTWKSKEYLRTYEKKIDQMHLE